MRWGIQADRAVVSKITDYSCMDEPAELLCYGREVERNMRGRRHRRGRRRKALYFHDKELSGYFQYCGRSQMI
jgi:hypothetical protein